MQTCLDDFGVIEDHECSFGEEGRQGAEHGLADVTILIDEELAAVAFGQRELCNALVGQRIVVVAYLYVLCVHK